jgi:hypothetical protein
MQSWFRSACGLVLTFTAIGCGGPATPPTPPPAAAPAPTATTPPASPVTDPKGTIDAAKTVAAAANTATGARQVAAGTQPAPAAQPGQASTSSAVATAAPAITPTAPKYEPGGRRDPFDSLELKVGSDRATIAAAKLTGVIRSGAIALALVETSDGIGYILKTGDVLADGRLVEITGNSAVFAIATRPGSTANKVVLRLPSD